MQYNTIQLYREVTGQSPYPLFCLQTMYSDLHSVHYTMTCTVTHSDLRCNTIQYSDLRCRKFSLQVVRCVKVLCCARQWYTNSLTVPFFWASGLVVSGQVLTNVLYMYWQWYKSPLLNTVTIRDRWSRILFKAKLNRDTGCRHPDRGTDDDGWERMMVPLISILLSIIVVILRIIVIVIHK